MNQIAVEVGTDSENESRNGIAIGKCIFALLFDHF